MISIISGDLSRYPFKGKPRMIEENYNIFDFQLSVKDMEKINALNINKRFGDHPDDF
jgi:diketogulonate reductase-like aldo/keto reductase